MHVTNSETAACFPRVFIAFAGENVNVAVRKTLACEVSHKIPVLARLRDTFEEGQCRLGVLHSRVHVLYNFDEYLRELRIGQVLISLCGVLRQHLRVCKDFQCTTEIQVDKTKVLYECAED